MSDDQATGGPKPDGHTLRAALRRARLSEAEHADVVVELRVAELARLEVLADELTPVINEIPPGTSLIDCAVVPGSTPRLWIDLLGYVEMGHDRRSYRLVTESRAGRQVLLETADVKSMADRVTDYIAHRLVERERALESVRPSALAKLGPAAERLVKTTRDTSGRGDAAFWQVAFAFVLGLACGILAMIVLALVVTS